jgi:metallopeptidase family M12-like protein
MRAVLLFVLLLSAGSAIAAPAVLDRTQLDRIDKLAVGANFTIDRFPDGFGGESSVRFERIDVYAPGARIFVVDDAGQREVPRSKRVEWIGSNADGSVRVSIGFDPGVANLKGVGTSSAGTFVVSTQKTANGLRLRAVPVESTYPAGVVPEVLGTDDAKPSGRAMPSALEIALAGEAPAGSLRRAVVAVDTDNEFMSRRFSNNTTTASAWIADLFATMNVMYERDLDVRLTQGTTTLRVTTDPYTQNNSPADGGDLDEFGNYWQAHYNNVQRAFAILLSGKSSNQNSASGIAWINAYCENQSQGGSYSVNQIFTNAAIDVSLSARIVGHELGHNFGANHTHCTDISNGNEPVATNTIDQCYRGEAGSGCYGGAVSCPSAGPGHPLGTIMSYCNVGGTNGANCGQNVLQFHPTHVSALNTLIAQHTGACLTTLTDVIFQDGFD